MVLYKTNEVAELLKLDIETIRTHVLNGKIKAYKIGNTWRVKEEDLMAFIEKEPNTVQ